MQERTVTMHGKKLSLEGSVLAKGEKAPAFTLVDKTMNDMSLNDFKGRIVILSTVPSLDTPTCSIETSRFNHEAAALGEKVAIVTVSRDLPFAQARWCAAAGIDRLTTLSDYKNTSFSKEYGVFIKELSLLTRAIYIIDLQGNIVYSQFVPEITKEPDYKDVLDTVKKML